MAAFLEMENESIGNITITLCIWEINEGYTEVTLEILTSFVRWLRNSFQSNSITPLKSTKTEKTINLIITAVTNFYGYFSSNHT